MFGRAMASIALASALALPAAAPAEERPGTRIDIGTGAVTGVYYPAGGAICRMVNRGRADHGIRCGVDATDGSVANIEALRGGTLTLGIVQSDWQHHAVEGNSVFAGAGPFADLRTVFSLHAEPFTLVARRAAGIATLDDLRGKRVNLGNSGSGQRATMEVVMAAKGWTADDFSATSDLSAADQSAALCENAFDAMVHVVGHPSPAISAATEGCDVVIVPVTGPEIAALIDRTGYYIATEIPGGLYRGNMRPIPTFGVGATLVTTAEVPDDVVYALVGAVFDNLERFKALHPALGRLNPGAMARDGATAPLHPGAARYFREVGLIE